MNMRGEIKLIDLENRIEFPTPAEASQPSPWVDLPLDVTANILRRLDTVEILQSAQLVCTTWRNICRDPFIWRQISIECPNYRYREYCTMMCRRAVDRSQGQLIDLTIAYFGNDELLDYIVDRSSHLRRLTLASCEDREGRSAIRNHISSGCAVDEAVKKLPELEELNLIRPSYDLAVSPSWSMLNSFTLDRKWCRRPAAPPEDSGHEDSEYEFHRQFINDGNGDALAIAKNMPNLRHLRLYANDLNNKGLQAILDGCPHLESLDLRGCYGVNLEGELGMRCFEQIKHLRLPFDSSDENAWELDNVYATMSPCSTCLGSDFDYEFDYEHDFELYDDDCGDYLDDDVWPILTL